MLLFPLSSRYTKCSGAATDATFRPFGESGVACMVRSSWRLLSLYIIRWTQQASKPAHSY